MFNWFYNKSSLLSELLVHKYKKTNNNDKLHSCEEVLNLGIVGRESIMKFNGN